MKIILRFGAAYIAMFTSFSIHLHAGAHPEFFTGWGRGLALRLYIIYA